MIETTLSSIKHNAHYLKRYLNMVKAIQRKNKNYNGDSHLHHICPKTLFPQFSNLSNFKWNGLEVGYDEHLVLHHILARVYGGKMYHAFWCMVNGLNSNRDEEYAKISPRMYNEAMIERVKILKGSKHSEETKRKMSISRTGKKASEETRRKLLKRFENKENHPNYGKPLKEETKRKLSEGSRGICKNPVVTCPHCGKEGKSSGMGRWHFDKCKKERIKMTLYNQLIDHQKLARKDPDQVAIYGVLTVILGELETASKRSGEAVSDEQALTLIRKVMKGNNETLAAYKTAIPVRNSQKDLENVDKLEKENAFLNCFLPQQLSADQIRTIIEKAKVDGDIKTIGMAMAFLKANYGGQYDGAVASKIVKAYFEGVTSVK